MGIESGKCAPWGHYDDVDHQEDPKGSVQHLDYITGMESVKLYKQETYDLLDIRPGSVVLDVGCGVGDDVLGMAERLQGRGRIVGIDSSTTMIESALARAAQVDLPVEFHLGNVYALDFPAGTFDGTRADRLFHHLSEPDLALQEMIRATKPGGRIVLFDPDFDAAVIGATDGAVTRQVIHAIADRVRAGADARNHLMRMRRAGLVDVTVLPKTFLFLDYALGDKLLGIEDAMQRLLEHGDIAPVLAETWLHQLKAREDDNTYLSMIVGFTVVGRKPMRS